MHDDDDDRIPYDIHVSDYFHSFGMTVRARIIMYPLITKYIHRRGITL